MHLAWNNSFGHTDGRWRHPDSWRRNNYYTKPAMWEEIARIAERGSLDMLFFGDSAETPDTYKGSFDEAVKWGNHWPRHDMSALVPAMSRATEHIGFGLSMSTTYTHPFYLARFFNGLDHVTEGRIGWNIVTSARPNEAANYGYEKLMDHDRRYERADEFMQVCRKLWDSVDPAAVVLDPDTGVVVDPDGVHYIDHHGEWFNVRGPLPCLPSPQVYPVHIQAGQSGPGLALSARWAEMQFGSRRNLEGMIKHRQQLDEAVVAAGRQPEDVGIMWSVKVIVGDDEADARARHKALLELIPPNAGAIEMSKNLAFDLSQIPTGVPLADMKDEILAANGVQGLLPDLLSMSADGALSIEDLGRQMILGSGPLIVGSPGQVADELERMWIEYGARGGFMVEAQEMPSSLIDFVDKVVPILQERGLTRRGYEGSTLRDNISD